MLSRCLALLLAFTLLARAEEAPFEIQDGDRILFLGDTLLEREGNYGHLESRIARQFRGQRFTARNLSWSGELPTGWSRASFDPPAKGFERLKEDIASVKPTVVFLGFGMAASLQEMTDRSRDITLNRDPVRYGAEPMSAARFKRELGELMDAIQARDTGVPPVRYVLLSPLRHLDLRALRPGLPDPSAHNALLAEYAKVIAELAQERGARFVDLFNLWRGDETAQRTVLLDDVFDEVSPNGIHLSAIGHAMLAEEIAATLGWDLAMPESEEEFARWQDERSTLSVALRNLVVRKNELFFHRFRPANSTYLFGFRKHEQGQNAAEMPKFDPLIAKLEDEIEALKKSGQPAAPAAAKTVATLKDIEAPAHPGFQVADGYQIELWAENPLLEKPVQMNWDALGRLWVASSSLYPQIAPGEKANDKILILEDKDRDGKAETSTIFADGLLIPTAVVPDLVEYRKADTGNRKEESAAAPGNLSGIRYPLSGISPSACYVGQSTELLHLTDTDGDGRADRTRIVFSGFGTEDTHHLIHTLRWGPDGRLYFNQSIYIHSHLETPWGMVRLNSGGTFAYDPRTERVEVYIKGFVNTWGLAWDQWGQSFHTDGAGFGGIAWGFPGATFLSYEGARQILPTISPGNYPKFCGLELVHSPHFPAEWQGNAITCDFRAHRIVRFAIKDLSEAEDTGKRIPDTGKNPDSASPGNLSGIRYPLSGFAASEQPDFIRTSDLSFRPIDVKLGPDGALYIADWSNPVINHGEVDFRDPRRDKHMGRIWRVTRKDAPLVPWEPLVAAASSPRELLERLFSENAWDVEQARRILATLPRQAIDSLVDSWLSKRDFKPSPRIAAADQFDAALREGGWLLSNGVSTFSLVESLRTQPKGTTRALAARKLGSLYTDQNAAWKATGRNSLLGDLVAVPDYLQSLLKDPHPRVRLEAMRSMARVQMDSPELLREARRALTTRGIPESSAETLEAALNQPDGEAGKVQSEAQGGTFDKAAFSDTKDPFYGYAAWLSINDLADVWVEAIQRGEWQPDSPEKEKQLVWGLGAIQPELAGAALTKLFADGKIPLDGSGPWIELLGTAGGPRELRALLDRFAAGQLSDDTEKRATLAFLDAVSTRNVKPEGDLEAIIKGFAKKERDPNPEMVAAGLRTLGLWKLEGARELFVGVAGAKELPSPDLRAAAFEGLRSLGGPASLKAFEDFSAASQPLEVRHPAALNFARMNPGKGIPRALEVLAAMPENAALDFWRSLLAIGGAPNQIMKAVDDAKLPKPVLEAGVRAAREAGKNGRQLLAKLGPLAGVNVQSAQAADYQDLAVQAKQQGDAVRGEFIYRRAALICTTCHAIGGAGGKVGPDMTSIGASAPLDYLIESLLDPAAKVKEGFNAVNVTLKDGTVVMGIQARESASEIVLRDATGAEKPVAKAQIASTANIGSLMPAGLLDSLQPRERLDLYAFLGELGKPGPFDASKGHVARVWMLTAPNAPTPIPAYTLVDGRLVKDLLAEKLLMLGAAPAIKATARFQGPGGKTRLRISGAKKAWLDDQPLDLAQEIAPDLTSAVHTLTVELDPKNPPEALRAESPDARFLGD